MTFSILLISCDEISSDVNAKQKDPVILNRIKLMLKLMNLNYIVYEENVEEINWFNNLPILLEASDSAQTKIMYNTWIKSQWREKKYRDIFSAEFVIQSFSKNLYPNLNLYRLLPSNFIYYNANKLINNEINWKNLTLCEENVPFLYLLQDTVPFASTPTLDTDSPPQSVFNNSCKTLEIYHPPKKNVDSSDKRHISSFVTYSSDDEDEELDKTYSPKYSYSSKNKSSKEKTRKREVPLSEVQMFFNFIISNNYHDRVKGIKIYKEISKLGITTLSVNAIKWQVEKYSRSDNIHQIEISKEDYLKISETFKFDKEKNLLCE